MSTGSVRFQRLRLNKYVIRLSGWAFTKIKVWYTRTEYSILVHKAYNKIAFFDLIKIYLQRGYLFKCPICKLF